MTKVLVTGVSGQDGSNMADFLLANTNMDVYGAVRHKSNPDLTNIEHLLENSRFHLVIMDITDFACVCNTVANVMPDYIINLAAQSFVGESWNSPVSTFMVNAVGVMHLLEAIRKYKPSCRFYSAGSSEEFGNVEYSPQDLLHPIKPRSPYGASKASARHIVKVYRESYGLYAIHSILFNHEGPRRGKDFVTMKVAKGIAAIKRALDRGDVPTALRLGNMDSMRDWGDSRDFVRGIWMMLNQDTPKEFLLATGETHSVKEFVEEACRCANVPFRWEGEGEKTVLYSGDHPIVVVDPKFYRPAEVDLLLGDPSAIREELGWTPSITFKDLVRDMVESELSGK